MTSPKPPEGVEVDWGQVEAIKQCPGPLTKTGTLKLLSAIGALKAQLRAAEVQRDLLEKTLLEERSVYKKHLASIRREGAREEREETLRKVWYDLKASLGPGAHQQILNDVIDRARTEASDG